eukprot:6163735-Pyramimonas_sp.AAC.1
MIQDVSGPDFMASDASVRLAEIKEAKKVVALRVKDWVFEKGARTPEENMYCVLAVLRGFALGILGRP